MKIETLALMRQYIAAIEDFVAQFDYLAAPMQIREIGRQLDVALNNEENLILLAAAREHFPKGLYVQVCANPRCGHNAGVRGTIDLVGFFDGETEVGITIMRDGGGMCGPFRVNELTRIA